MHVYAFFIKTEDQDLTKSTIQYQCKCCGKPIKSTGSTKLNLHLNTCYATTINFLTKAEPIKLEFPNF